jgi:hypothetical protein
MAEIYDEAGIWHGPVEFNGFYEGYRMIWYWDDMVRGRKQFKTVYYPSAEWTDEVGGIHLKLWDEFYPPEDELAGRSKYGRRGLLEGWRCSKGHQVNGSQYGCHVRGCAERRPLPKVPNSRMLYSKGYNERMKRVMAREHEAQRVRRRHAHGSYGCH